MKRNVHTPFGLPLADGKVEEFGRGIHDFSADQVNHWMVQACSDEINDAEFAAAEAERDALAQRVKQLEDANSDLLAQAEAVRGREADLVKMLEDARAEAASARAAAVKTVGTDANGSPTSETPAEAIAASVSASANAAKPAVKK